MIKIVIVEDKKIVREGLAVLLGASGELSCVDKYANAGRSPMTSRIARRVVTLFQDRFQPPRESEVHITEREQEVLTALAQGHSNAAIADASSTCIPSPRRWPEVEDVSTAVARPCVASTKGVGISARRPFPVVRA